MRFSSPLWPGQEGLNNSMIPLLCASRERYAYKHGRTVPVASCHAPYPRTYPGVGVDDLAEDQETGNTMTLPGTGNAYALSRKLHTLTSMGGATCCVSTVMWPA